MATTSTIKLNIIVYFENLIIGLYAFHVLNMHLNFCANKILFTIRSINLFL